MTYFPNTTNTISTLNTSAIASFAADEVFQGTGEDVSTYGRAGIAVTSDNATSGVLTVEVSHDGVTWGGPTRSWADTRFGKPHMWNIVEKYFRVKYTNGAVAATNLSIQVQYSTNADILLAHELGSILSTEDEAILVRPGTDFDLDSAREHITGQQSFFFFGFNNAVDTNWEDIHPTGGDITWLTTASAIEIISTNAADTGAGLGVQSVEVHGLSTGGIDQSEIITTSGTTASVSTLTYSRVNKLHSESVGTYGGSHQGDITCQAEGGGPVLSKMTGVEGAAGSTVQYGSGEAGNGYWSVPLGKVMYITRLTVIPDVATNKTVDVVLYERDDLLDVTTSFSPRRVLWQESAVDQPIEKEFKSHIKIKALTDVWFRAKASATSKIEVSLDFFLVNSDANGR